MSKNSSRAFIAAPTNLGLSRNRDGNERGCYKLPEALQQGGFLEHTHACSFASIVRPSYPKQKEYVEGTLFGSQIHAFSLELATVVSAALDAGHFPIVAGGDCSVLVGSALALARRGRYGLVFLDAHVDYAHPGNCEIAAVAGMDLAIATGKGISLLADIDCLKPYIREEDAVAFGYRSPVGADTWMIDEIKQTSIRCIELEDAKRKGLGETMQEALEQLRQQQVAGVWLHLDADILDAAIMPAVDCPETGGLFEEELTQVLTPLLQSDLVVGMDLTILDPDLDPEGQALSIFSHCISNAFQAIH